MLWTGGNDSALALYRASEQGLEIVDLVTFVSAGNATFLAHPLPEMAMQASQIGIEHNAYVVDAPYRDGYIAALKGIKENLLVEAVITGDIDSVEGLPNWIQGWAAKVGPQTVMPLWKADRREMLLEVIRRGIRSRVSWIKDSCIP
jgi:diphthamide synthase (EF-2-diphthine--ammonia ligase)